MKLLGNEKTWMNKLWMNLSVLQNLLKFMCRLLFFILLIKLVLTVDFFHIFPSLLAYRPVLFYTQYYTTSTHTKRTQRTWTRLIWNKPLQTQVKSKPHYERKRKPQHMAIMMARQCRSAGLLAQQIAHELKSETTKTREQIVANCLYKHIREKIDSFMKRIKIKLN